MMTKTQRLFLAMLFILSVTHTYADVYRCKDSTGHVVTSDRPIPECADKSTQVYTNSGVFKDQLPAPLTPEQRQSAKLQEQQKLRESQEQEARRKEQQYLITHYPAEQDIEIARQKELSALDTKIATEKQNVNVAMEALTNNQRMQSNLPKNENDKLFEAQMKGDALKQTIQQSNHLIQQYTTAKTNINRQFDATHRRYLEIVGPDKN